MALLPAGAPQGLGLRDGVLRPVCVRSSLLGRSRATLSTFPEVLRSAVPFVSAAAAWAALRLQRGATSLRARSFRVDEVKTTELEEALRFLGFDSFPKMKNRQSLVKWIREWRIPHQMLEGALSEVRKIRKADLRSKASAKAKAERGRESSRSGSQPRSSSRKTRRGGNLYEFTDGQLRTALNVCGVQGTADWHKRDLVRKLQSMGIRVKDVQALIDEMNPSGKRHRRQNSRSRGKRRPPMSRAERDFFADDARVVNEFLREEYDDWDDEDEDDYFDFTMDDEPWDSVPWDSEFDDYFADAHEETQYGNFRRGSKGPAENYSYSAPGPDPWNSPGGWTYTSASGYTGSYYSARSQSTGSTWPKSPKVTPEEAMSRALREGWKAEGMSRTQACMLLGLSGQPMPTEVQKVRRQMALRWHPDKNPDNAEAHMAFQLVMAAAEKLNA